MLISHVQLVGGQASLNFSLEISHHGLNKVWRVRRGFGLITFGLITLGLIVHSDLISGSESMLTKYYWQFGILGH